MNHVFKIAWMKWRWLCGKVKKHINKCTSFIVIATTPVYQRLIRFFSLSQYFLWGRKNDSVISYSSVNCTSWVEMRKIRYTIHVTITITITISGISYQQRLQFWWERMCALRAMWGIWILQMNEKGNHNRVTFLYEGAQVSYSYLSWSGCRCRFCFSQYYCAIYTNEVVSRISPSRAIHTGDVHIVFRTKYMQLYCPFILADKVNCLSWQFHDSVWMRDIFICLLLARECDEGVKSEWFRP